MSDFYGAPTLEGWLAEEVLQYNGKIPQHIVEKFEKWRQGIEANIHLWLDTDDGDGNQLSWRGWGRGFYGIPDEDEHEFQTIALCAQEELNNLMLQKQGDNNEIT